ncbi:MAG: hypothetical protein C4297_04955 [Gemmataceae bacterium]
MNEQKRLLLFMFLSLLAISIWSWWIGRQQARSPQTSAQRAAHVVAAQLARPVNRWTLLLLGPTPSPAGLSLPVPPPPADQLEQALAYFHKREHERQLELAKQREEELRRNLDEDTVQLGGPHSKLTVQLSKRYAAVRRIVLRDFQQASRDEGRPLFDAQGQPEPLVLVDNGGRFDANHFSFVLEPSGSTQQIAWHLVRAEGDVAEFAAELPEHNVRVRKRYELDPGSYHVRLRLFFERLDAGRAASFAYQLTGPRGLPVEGELWHVAAYRHVVLGLVDNRYETLRRVSYDPQQLRGGALTVELTADQQSVQYAGVLVQYFAALVAVDSAATEQPVFARVIAEYLEDDAQYRPDKKKLMGHVAPRLVSLPIELPAQGHIEHRLLLYAGPAKVRLLRYDRTVSNDAVERYLNVLQFNTLTDYPYFSWTGKIGWTAVVVACTNIMHWLLETLHALVGNYGIAIILLTFLVRGAMFPVSRKQALTSQRMQKLQPEMRALMEKYKNDRQALARAQMELYRKYQVNPFSGCLIVLLQMPVFLGLYYALYESVHLRLARFLWIRNLAAPDMLIYWGNWPVIGWLAEFLHLGPYFHLLPVLAVALMLAQQKLLMPPPADEQQAAQMRVMNFMLVFFGYLFYWVAAGLCIYFSVSSLWGMIERKLIQKLAHDAPAPVVQAKAERKERPTKKRGREPTSNGPVRRPAWMQKLVDAWRELLRRAEKK